MTITDLLNMAEQQHMPAAVEFHPGSDPTNPGRGYVVRLGDVESAKTLRLDDAILGGVAAMMGLVAELAMELDAAKAKKKAKE